MDEVIKSTPLLEPEACEDLFQRVLEARPHWTARRGEWMFTLGAASYLDGPACDRLARNTNPVLLATFGDLYDRLGKHFEAALHAPVGYDPAIALPGFHVFVCGPQMRGEQARIHRDTPHLQRAWDGPISDPFSFTLPVRLPAAGGGLNYWVGLAARYLPYEPGRLYVVGPDVVHQIANRVDLADGEYRVTLQGHGVRRSDGSYVLFF